MKNLSSIVAALLVLGLTFIYFVDSGKGFVYRNNAGYHLTILINDSAGTSTIYNNEGTHFTDTSAAAREQVFGRNWRSQESKERLIRNTISLMNPVIGE